MVIMGRLDDGKSSGDVVLERLTQYIISPKYLPHVSWTGRGKEKERKFALSACNQVVNFIVIIVNKADSNYNHKKVVSELIYNILKRAPSKFGKPKASNQKDSPASSSEESSSSSSKPPTPTPSLSETITHNHQPLPLRTTSEHFQYYAPSQQIASISQQPLPPMNYWDARFSPYYPPSRH